jgi:predicted ribosomally synthesized peptide with SipW-like signal peptide
MSLVVILGLVGGGAFAAFSDTETSAGNTFSAGTLDLTYNIAYTYSGAGTVTVTPLGAGVENNGVDSHISFANVAPGDSGVITWKITNAGSLPGKLNVQTHRVNDYDGVNPEPELVIEGIGITGTTPGELDNNMWLTTDYWMDAGTVYHWGPGYISGASTEWYNIDSLPMLMPSGSVYTIQWTWSIDAGVGNIIQGDSFGMDLRMYLTKP